LGGDISAFKKKLRFYWGRTSGLKGVVGNDGWLECIRYSQIHRFPMGDNNGDNVAGFYRLQKIPFDAMSQSDYFI